MILTIQNYDWRAFPPGESYAARACFERMARAHPHARLVTEEDGGAIVEWSDEPLDNPCPDSPVVEEPGWAWPEQAAKAHYFETNGRSLCGRWLYMGERDVNQKPGEKLSKGDCAECWRKVTTW